MKKKYLLLFSLTILCCICSAIYYFLAFQKSEKIYFKLSTYEQLPGWQQADLRPSLKTFLVSCHAFLKQDPNKPVGSEPIDIYIKDWQPACKAALNIKNPTIENSKKFFETWFIPIIFYDKQPIQGLFTGYYMPLIKGSLVKTKKYTVPLYSVPDNLLSIDLSAFDPTLNHRKLFARIKGKKIVPYFTRAEINQGAIEHHAKVIAWLENKLDRSFLEIQGSGIIALPDGKQLFIGYAAQNGAPYHSIAKVLIDQGVMTFDNASMQNIRQYLEKNPHETDHVLNQNPSFVFFEKLNQEAALGSQGVALTPGYSLAIDRQWVPHGTPIWLHTSRPSLKHEGQYAFQRLVIAQDTGGAIKGKVRGDVFWGAGDHASHIAGRMKNNGYYWLLLPKPVLNRLDLLKE